MVFTWDQKANYFVKKAVWFPSSLINLKNSVFLVWVCNFYLQQIHYWLCRSCLLIFIKKKKISPKNFKIGKKRKQNEKMWKTKKRWVSEFFWYQSSVNWKKIFRCVCFKVDYITGSEISQRRYRYCVFLIFGRFNAQYGIWCIYSC